MIRRDVALLRVEDLTVRRGTQTVLENYNLEIGSGECVLLTGENGSGKSTLIEAIAGILPIQSGKVVLNRPFGLTLQSGGFNGDEMVDERLGFAAQAAGVMEENVLQHWNLSHRSQDRIGHLSGGLHRRLSVIQGLLPGYGKEERICLLDEPSEGLDEESVDTLMADISTLRARGHSFLIATHDNRLRECATRVQVLGGEPSANEPTIEAGDAPLFANVAPKLDVTKWSTTIDRRTMWPLLSRGIPLIGSILILYALLGKEIGALVLVPAFLASIPPLASLHHSKDSRSGDWWQAMGARLFTVSPLSILLIFIAPILTATIFGVQHDTKIWMAIGLPFIGIHLASGAIHELAMKMPRAGAQYTPLLSLVLIWPLLIATDAISGCSGGEICTSPWASIAIATSIPLIIWFGLPILHPRTGSN